MSEISIFDSAYGRKSLLREHGAVFELIQIFTGKKVGRRNMFGANNSQCHKTSVPVAFPSAWSKMNFAMLIPPKRLNDADWKS
jgi:GTP-dependent phosphoenolpyruvate carboxykinase